MSFSREDRLKAMAVVHIFETGRPIGDYAACAVLDDGAGISYGINQFTHRSGSLAAVVEKYLEIDGAIGREVIDERLPTLKKTSKVAIGKLAADQQFKKALKAAAVTREMREAQEAVAFEKYLKPAIDECERLGFKLPLSLAVVYDSIVHGSWEKIRDRVRVTPSGVSETAKAVTLTTAADEKRWIISYVRLRHIWLRTVPRLKKTSYRTEFFLRQMTLGKWELELPMIVHGVRLTNANGFRTAESEDPKNSPTKNSNKVSQTASNPPADTVSTAECPPPRSSSTGRAREGAAHAEDSCLNKIEERVNEVAEKIDQADRVATTVQTRTDKAKSLWTTVAGTSWQMLWAIAGFLAGVPREVWLVVAVIAGALMLLYLYRQVALGKIRENS